jgi:hypothetical protein
VVRSSPLRTGRLYPQEFSWYSFLEAESTPEHMVPSAATEKIPSDTTGDRSHDPPTSSAVPWVIVLDIINNCAFISIHNSKEKKCSLIIHVLVVNR